MKPRQISNANDVIHSISTLTLNLTNENERTVSPFPVHVTEDPIFIKNFRSRRKQHEPWKTASIVFDRENTCPNMALSGTKYLDQRIKDSDKINENSIKDESENKPKTATDETVKSTRKSAAKSEDPETITEPKSLTTEGRLPPIIHSVRPETVSKSYVRNGFGFNQFRTDTFIGLKTPLRSKRRIQIDGQIAAQARRHLFACGNAGSVRKSCRANESVIGLKQTMLTGLEQTSVDYDYKINQLIPDRLIFDIKSNKVFTRSDITRRSVTERKDKPLPKISGFSILN